MIHVSKNGEVMLKGEPEEIAKNYMDLIKYIAKNNGAARFIIAELIDEEIQHKLAEMEYRDHLGSAAQIDFGKGELE